MSTHSEDGREWLRVSEVKVGLRVRVDGGFSCLPGGAGRTIKHDEAYGLFIECFCGKHYLDGQLNVNQTHYVGMWPA